MLALSLILALGCSTVRPVPSTSGLESESDHVLVVVNTASDDSVQVGAYYRQKRGVPKENVVLISCGTSDNVPEGEFRKNIEEPVKKAAKDSKKRIDYIVLTKGIPLRMNDDGGFSVDAWLAVTNLTIQAIGGPNEEAIKKSLNPYFQKDESFSSDKYHGMYLVTRLDGPTAADAKRLVDNSLAAKPDKGPFFFDQAGNRKDGGYGTMNETLQKAYDSLRTKGFQTALDTTDSFIAPEEALMGYCSWGSNDSHFDSNTYRKLKFKPGSIAETFVSTSGRTFSHAKDGQSQVTDLIEQGVTGIKGYVSEPYTFALARPEILFDRYTRGYNLAESFYMASLVVKWKDIVIGDPLCRPYPKK